MDSSGNGGKTALHVVTCEIHTYMSHSAIHVLPFFLFLFSFVCFFLFFASEHHVYILHHELTWKYHNFLSVGLYLSFRLAAKTTFAPFSARALATASPIPLEAPVTMATLPPRDLGP